MPDTKTTIPTTAEGIHAAVKAAVAKLDPENPAHWNPQDGTPRLDVLSDLAGFQVTRAKLTVSMGGPVVRPGWTPPAAAPADAGLRARVDELAARVQALEIQVSGGSGAKAPPPPPPAGDGDPGGQEGGQGGGQEGAKPDPKADGKKG